MEDTFININLEEVEDGFEAMADGPCKITIATTEKKQKDGGDYPYIEVMMHPRDEALKNRQLYRKLFLSPKSLWHTKEFVVASGIRWNAKGFDHRDLVGKDLVVNLKIVPKWNDPDKKVNEVDRPYHAG